MLLMHTLAPHRVVADGGLEAVIGTAVTSSSSRRHHQQLRSDSGSRTARPLVPHVIQVRKHMRSLSARPCTMRTGRAGAFCPGPSTRTATP